MKLYKTLVQKKKPSKGTFGLIGILIVFILMYMGINKYVSYLSENSSGIDLDKIGYFAYPTFVFGITVTIGILILLLRKDESIPNQI
ncbi:hypothetical protein [Poritiphilus flavus]|uniref:Uncharacterized protein n=1 Tax=Poritiphilus flavus TaxID=2697053 RepID=A0A6L9EED6_9FLAO|nr:hypothetical protein [Poritiphilus flavus]NAS12908.1 hypothetical protein [Poritiphilus flavus]